MGYMIVQNGSNKLPVKYQTPTRQGQKGAITQIKMHLQKREAQSFGSTSSEDGGDSGSESLPMMDSIVWPIGTHFWKLNNTGSKILRIFLRNWIVLLPSNVHRWWQRASTTVAAPPHHNQQVEQNWKVHRHILPPHGVHFGLHNDLLSFCWFTLEQGYIIFSV